MRQDLHTHTTYCDGNNTPEEMILSAIDKGFDRIGFSGHGHTAIDESYCMSAESAAAYRRELAALKDKYRDRIEVLCGVEQDYYGDLPTDEYDYVIGSVHYIGIGEDYIPVDESAAILTAAVDRHFAGDWYALCEAYYRLVAEVVEKTGADIIGHFDLITKFNEGGCLFDESHPRYIAAATAAIDRLLPTGKPFEINTGAISRGYRTTPYPALPLQQYIIAHGGRLLQSSDSHATDTIGFEFEQWMP